MKKNQLSLLATWWLPAASLLLGGCAASIPRSGQPLPGVSLRGQGSDLVLAWQDESFLTRVLRPGTTIDVVAAYPTARGPISGDVVATTRYTAGNRALFQLKDAVQVAPMGPVCLRLRVNGRSALPLRAADGATGTDGFRFDGWALRAAHQAERGQLERERQSLTAAAGTSENTRLVFEKWKLDRRVPDIAACEGMSVANAVERPASAIDPSMHVQQAERECVWRLSRYLAGDSVNKTGDVINGLAGNLLQRKQADPQSVAQMDALLNRLRSVSAATQRHLPEVARASYRPLVSAYPLQVSTSTKEALNKGELSNATSGILDAWDSCLKDTRSQFQLSFESWTREQDPRLRQSQARALQAECRARFDDAARRQQDNAAYRERLQAIDARMQVLGTPPAASTGASELIDQACS